MQVICAVHCVRRGNYRWLWLIILLPMVGCLVYIFTEMFTGREIQNVQAGVNLVFNPGGSIKKLEQNLRFSDTFANKVALADAYLTIEETAKAIELYESSMTGNFIDNEYVLGQLVLAYFQAKRYEEVITVARKIYHLPEFARSKKHILYALALDYTGNATQAEREFGSMKARFSNFEARYQYSLMLARNGRNNEAHKLLKEMVEEAGQLSSRERKYNRRWLSLAKDELKKMNA